MRFVVVCGCGCGSSVILKMNVVKVLKKLNIQADVEVSDSTTYKAAIRGADLLLVNSEMAEVIKTEDVPVVVLNSFVNIDEIQNKLEPKLKELNIIN